MVHNSESFADVALMLENYYRYFTILFQSTISSVESVGSPLKSTCS